jgi:two-component system response regulator MtrA
LQRSEKLQWGELSLEFESRQVQVRGEPVELTRVEFEILAALARRPGAAISRAALVASALDPEREGGERTLDVHISRLRKKLGACGELVGTVWGVGYRLAAP